ncbi:triose-phosphate isomerase [Leptolinea tardivitalis]|uniref:Triosephosphate isomerase n=1 Tax=Leptolinea tardivitalis TaxID=229920 RepID=A0A0P6X660_9CHLR|nr:triose-phosphate isomerase [Leptolinea tardivitalis]KPL70433.1 triosephosphate isomerase [Leptolinea tardivitalis]GAP22016.1 triosephosphate isomerase [Leptolinea tardivitalis]
MTSSDRLLIGSNLKMYKTIAETVDYLSRLVSVTSDLPRESIDIFIIPSFTALPAASMLKSDRLKLGAQNMNWADSGQYTGEISPVMLRELGIDVVEIGHSERRHVFGETDDETNRKVIAAVNHGFTALLCIGETASDKNLGISEERIRIQLKIGLHDFPKEKLSRLWIAYEPVWAIGVNGTPAAPDYVEEAHARIRSTLEELFPGEADHIPILYGGSVNKQNCCELIALPGVDGLFIGRAAWNADDMNTIIRMTLPIWQEKIKLTA